MKRLYARRERTPRLALGAPRTCDLPEKRRRWGPGPWRMGRIWAMWVEPWAGLSLWSLGVG